MFQELSRLFDQSLKNDVSLEFGCVQLIFLFVSNPPPPTNNEEKDTIYIYELTQNPRKTRRLIIDEENRGK